MTTAYQRLVRDDALIELLDILSDVQMRFDAENEAPFPRIHGEPPLALFARDGAGGQFASSPRTGRVFYVTSEGEGGLMARDVERFLHIVVALPYWQDVLHCAGGGQLDKMRRAAEVFESRFGDEDDELPDIRDELRRALGLADDGDVVAELHAAVTTEVGFVLSEDEVIAPLFGRFTVDESA